MKFPKIINPKRTSVSLKKALQNLVPLAFVIGFFWLIFLTIFADESAAQMPQFRVRSHLLFSKKFSGTAFVLDGDSIKVGKKEVRLFGIDAPEYKQQCLDKTDMEYACGVKSRDFLVNLVGGKFVECAYSEKDKYNRFLGKCYVDKVFINAEMVKSGMAVVYNFSEDDKKIDKLEEEAKEKKIGIWQGSFQLPKEYRKQHPKKPRKSSN